MRTGRTTFEEIVRRFGRPNFSSTSWDGTRTAAYSVRRRSILRRARAAGAGRRAWRLGRRYGGALLRRQGSVDRLQGQPGGSAPRRPSRPAGNTLCRALPRRSGAVSGGQTRWRRDCPTGRSYAARTRARGQARGGAGGQARTDEVTVCRPGCRRARRETADIRSHGPSELRMPLDPLRRLLVGVRDAVDHRFAERPADDLHRQRQPRLAETDRH